MLLLPHLKFTPFSFDEIQRKRKTFSLAVFFCRWYISSETILRYWFSWKVSIKVLSCTSLVSNLSNKSNKIFPYDLISLFQTVQFIICSPNRKQFQDKAGKYKHWLKIWQMKWIVWQFNTSTLDRRIWQNCWLLYASVTLSGFDVAIVDSKSYGT